MVDRDLVEQARRGDREAFAVLVHQVSDSLYSVAYRILRDTGLAEDVLQNLTESVCPAHETLLVEGAVRSHLSVQPWQSQPEGG